MFHKRSNSQKPDEDLIGRFQQTFAGVLSSNDQETVQPSSITRLHNPTPQALGDFRFTPFVDQSTPYSQSLARQWAGYSTPGLAGMDRVFHNQAGDLLTPTRALNAPHYFYCQHPGDHSNPQYFPQQFLSPRSLAQDPLATCAPDTLFQYDTRQNDAREPSEGSSRSASAVDPADQMDIQKTGWNDSKFRYNATLSAPTAMLKNRNDIPITYLNKGQIYHLSLVDSTPASIGITRYRTSVRVSFEEQDQISNPVGCWDLWKQGRGLHEARLRDGKLHAVEYIGGPNDDLKHGQLHLESASVDGFCVTWTASPAMGVHGSIIPLRFNFLSTDFTHAKGVKGVSVRLCAKTEMLPAEGLDSGDAEVCYCKVKLFRDHGAERKLANDIGHVKKRIEKLGHSIAQARADLGRTRPGPRKKTRKTDATDDGFEHVLPEEDVYTKLAALQDMFSSNRPVSVLSLRGESKDDPDLFPVRFQDEADGFTPISDSKLPGHNVVDVDPTYTPPVKQKPRAVACFYIRFPQKKTQKGNYYHAVYLTERTVRDLVEKICQKQKIAPDCVAHVLHINQKGLQIIVDDDVVREIPEGQDMVAEASGGEITLTF